MSAVSSRKQANVIESALIPVGAIVVGACLLGLAKGLSAVAKSALKESAEKAPVSYPNCLKSVAGLGAEASAPLALTNVGDGNLETFKTEAFKQLASQPYLMTNPAELEPSLLMLDRAKTLEELKTAHQNALATLKSGHQQIFTDALVEAARQAALKIGFTKIVTLPTALQSAVRLAATDALGRTLVTEVWAPTGGDVRLETEIVGVTDGSCNAILDAFDKALEAEGVRSQPPKRKYTGGVCETAAVRDFLAQKVNPEVVKTFQAENCASTDDVKRRQRLNRKTQTQRQK